MAYAGHKRHNSTLSADNDPLVREIPAQSALRENENSTVQDSYQLFPDP